MSKMKNLNNCCKTLWNNIIRDMEPPMFGKYLRQITPIIMANGVALFTTDDYETVEMFNGKYNRHVKELLKDATGEEWAVECVLNDAYYSVLEDAKSITVKDGVLVDVDYSAEIMKIGADVHKIGSMSVFAFHENLRCIQVDKDNEYFASKDGVLFTKDMETLVVYPSAKIDEEYIIPDNVVSIKSDAFYGNENLKSVTMPDSVEKVGDYAFYGCCNLEQIKLSENLEYISDFMLNDCRALKSIKIPDSVKEIKRYAFRECSGLTSVKIPEEVFCIEEYAFAKCEKLKSVFLNVATIEKNAFRGSRNVTLYSEFECVKEYAEKNKIKFKRIEFSEEDE